MDRQYTYPGEIITDLKLLLMQRNAEVGIGHLARAVLGTGPTVAGLACNATSPASMSVTVGTGSIYSLQPFEATPMGSLAADTADTLVKQGLNTAVQTFSCPAPTTSGESIVYLIEAAYQDYDTNDQALTFFNSTNPAQPYTGPNGNGVSQPTVRQGLCSLQLVAGTAATTGSQTTPATSSGYSALYTITVPFGATTITASNITTAPGAPFIPYTLPQLGTLIGGYTQSLTANGYQTLPTGLILQWGTGTVPSENTAAITFPLTFPNVCFVVSASIDLNYVPDLGDGNFSCYAGAWSKTGATLVLDSNNTGSGLPSSFTVVYIAIGY